MHGSYEIPHVLSLVLHSSSVGAHSHSWKQGAELGGLFWVYFVVWNEQHLPFCLIQVTFLNETTGEYLFHMVTFKVTASGPMGTVKMSTAVRQRVSSTVKVENPLPVPVTFDINCQVPDVSVPQHFTVPAQSKVGAKLLRLTLLSLLVAGGGALEG